MTTDKTVGRAEKRGTAYRTERPGFWTALAMGLTFASLLTAWALFIGWLIAGFMA